MGWWIPTILAWAVASCGGSADEPTETVIELGQPYERAPGVVVMDAPLEGLEWTAQRSGGVGVRLDLSGPDSPASVTGLELGARTWAIGGRLSSGGLYATRSWSWREQAWALPWADTPERAALIVTVPPGLGPENWPRRATLTIRSEEDEP